MFYWSPRVRFQCSLFRGNASLRHFPLVASSGSSATWPLSSIIFHWSRRAVPVPTDPLASGVCSSGHRCGSSAFYSLRHFPLVTSSGSSANWPPCEQCMFQWSPVRFQCSLLRGIAPLRRLLLVIGGRFRCNSIVTARNAESIHLCDAGAPLGAIYLPRTVNIVADVSWFEYFFAFQHELITSRPFNVLLTKQQLGHSSKSIQFISNKSN